MPRKAVPVVALARKRPTQVTGAIVAAVECEGFEFGKRRRVSPYDALLEQLLDAPKGSVLKIETGNPASAWHSCKKRAEKKGLRAEFAEADGAIYIRIVPNGPPKQSVSIVSHQACLQAIAAEDGTATAKGILRRSGLTREVCLQALGELVKAGTVEFDGTVYRKAR